MIMKAFRVICFILFLAALGFTIHSFLESRRLEPAPYYAVREPRPVPAPQPVPVPAPEQDTEHPEEPEPEPEPRVLLPNIIELRDRYNNPDIIGYIHIPNTNISYPIAQTGNNVYYLYHNLHFERDRAGAVFLDYWNDFYDLTCDNFIVFGHNMRAGTKFHNVRYFARADYFRDRPFIYITTPYEDTVWEIFSFFRTTTAFDYVIPQFPTRESFYDFITFIQRSSLHSTDVVLTPYCQIVILSTCGVNGGADRYILVARLQQNIEGMAG